MTLRIKFEIEYNEVVPTEYELKGNVCCTEDVYYSVVSERMDMFYPIRTTMNANEPFTVWCARKVDFSGMIDEEIKNVDEKGKIINFKNNVISMKSNALQCVTWADHMLARIYFQLVTNQTDRRKLPQYLIVNDLAQLRENVFFYFVWYDGLTENTKQLSDVNKYLELTFRLFNTKDNAEDDET